MVGLRRWRMVSLAAVFVAVLCVFWGRLYFLQVTTHTRLRDMADSQQIVRVAIPAERGRIYDRTGQLLATSTMVNSVFVNPAEIEDVEGTAAALASALKLDARAIANAMRAQPNRRFLYVKRHVTGAEEAAVRALRLKGAYFREEPKRFYPNGKMLAHVLGFTGVDQHGLAGVEFAFESRLSGTSGLREERRDGLSRTIYSPDYAYTAAVNGNSVVLTIDMNIQDFLESAVDRCQQQYAPLSVTGIVMDPKTGEILALAERPAFDPNGYARYHSDTWRLRAITDPYEPGSMFKPFVFAAALEEGAVGLDDVIFCGNGSYTIGRRVLRDHHPYGNLTARQVVGKSSNIGMAKIGQALGTVKAYGYLQAFGFGRRTGIQLSSEDSGLVMPLSRWSSYTITSVPMGHEVSVTSVQMAAAFSAFGNGGYLVKPRLLRGVVSPEGEVLERFGGADVKARVISEETARVMITDVLHRVVKEGTGRLADLEDYNIAGKTGTAQKLVDGRYSHSKYVSSFICAGPVEDARAVVLFVVNEPTRGASLFGGTAAAPYAAEVLKATLDYMFIDGRRRARPASYAAAGGASRREAEAGHAP